MDAFQVEHVAPIFTRPHFGGRLYAIIHRKNKSGAVWGAMVGPVRAIFYNGVRLIWLRKTVRTWNVANQKSDRIPIECTRLGFPRILKNQTELWEKKLFRKLLFETDYAMLTVRACTSLQYNKYKLELLICCSLLHAYIVIHDAHTCRLTGLRTCRGRKGGEISWSSSKPSFAWLLILLLVVHYSGNSCMSILNYNNF